MSGMSGTYRVTPQGVLLTPTGMSGMSGMGGMGGMSGMQGMGGMR
jgi:hypothetical protein